MARSKTNFMSSWKRVLPLFFVFFLTWDKSDAQSNIKPTLFTVDDPVAQLWPDNFTQVVHGSNQLWIVMFYAAWCGHCRRAAPVYRNFSMQIKGWEPVVKTAAVACSDPTNLRLCSHYGITGYPTYKLFPPKSDPSFRGTPAGGVDDLDMTGDLRRIVLSFVNQLVASQNALESWPRLDTISDSSQLWNSDTEKIIIIAEDDDMKEDLTGLSVLMDLLPLRPTVVSGRMDVTQARVSKPGIYLLTRENHNPVLISDSKDEEVMVQAITYHFGLVSGSINSSYGNYQTTVKPVESEFPPPGSSVYSPRGLRMRDLESGLYRLLFLEVPTHENIGREELRVLKSFVRLLAYHHPAEQHVRSYLISLDDWLNEFNRQEISADDWTRQLNSLQTRDSYIPKAERYTGCAGSREGLRGYTCSLWMTFHALTVSAFKTANTTSSFNPLDILQPIADYVDHFFGCRECAHHFGEMAAGLRTELNSTEDVVLWLWRAHNRVNHRLHGDETEDRQAPKIQFPPQSACGPCRRRGEELFDVDDELWNEEEVLKYLVSYYGPEQLIDDHDETQDRPSNEDITRPDRQLNDSSTSCEHYQTTWSRCSSTCGEGMSTRLATHGQDCKLQVESRVCMLRPCNIAFTDWTRSRWHVANCPRLAHTYRLAHNQSLVVHRCTSVERRAWHICGTCPARYDDRPVCCRPARSNTELMEFNCRNNVIMADGRERISHFTMEMLVEVIDYCICDENCDD